MTIFMNRELPFLGSDHHAVGLNNAQFVRAVRTGMLRRLFHGVYIDARVAESRDMRIRAVQLVKPQHGVLCGPSASWLMGVDTFPPGRRFDFKPEFVVPTLRARSRSPLISCRRALIHPNDITETSGILHVTPLRVASDLLRSLRRPYALSAADSLAHAGLVSADAIQRYVDRLDGYRGVVQARELAQLIEPKSESPGEGWQRLRLHDAGFPRPVAQHEVRDRFGRVIGRLDNAYVEVKIGMEFDGKEFHSVDHDRSANESRRSALTDVFGWRMENSRSDDILGRDPAFEIQVGDWLGINPRLPRGW